MKSLPCRLAATSANKVPRPSNHSLTTATGSKRPRADSDSLLCHVRLRRTSRLIFGCGRESGAYADEIEFASLFLLLALLGLYLVGELTHMRSMCVGVAETGIEHRSPAKILKETFFLLALLSDQKRGKSHQRERSTLFEISPLSPRGDQCEQSAPTVRLQHNHGYRFETPPRRLGFTAVPCQATANLAVDIVVLKLGSARVDGIMRIFCFFAEVTVSTLSPCGGIDRFAQAKKAL